MHTAEDLQLLAIEQGGSRKGHGADDSALNKVLTFDIARQRKQPLALCSNDAVACYDRIVHSVASLAMQRVGVPLEPLVCMFTTIQNLEHHIRTIYGDSDLNFSGKLWVLPIQGIVQGNGAASQVWAIVSTPVLNIMRAEGYGVCFHTALTATEIHFVGYAFVDDTDLVQSKISSADSVHSLAAEMQSAVNLWEGTLRATGGAHGQLVNGVHNSRPNSRNSLIP